MAFEALEMSLIVLERLGPIEKKVRQKRKSLADEMGRAGESIPLNLSEGHKRAGLDRADLFRRAEGSSGELTTCLRIARLRELITQGELDWVDEPLDRVRAMLWKLTH
jgi:four helix bundle protein